MVAEHWVHSFIKRRPSKARSTDKISPSEGAESTGSSSNGCGIASASSSCSHHGPKHHREVVLHAEAAARVRGFRPGSRAGLI
jgi:hypothetical protein